MSATRLLILGAIREREIAHGYQVRLDLESWSAGVWGSLKQGSIYHGLNRLHDQGLLREVTGTGASAGPARTEYSLTGQGRREFITLLEASLSSAEGGLADAIAGIGFMTVLPRDRVVELLRDRVQAYRHKRAQVVDEYEQSQEADWAHHVEAIRLWAMTADSAIAWTEALIDRLEKGAYTMAGEDR